MALTNSTIGKRPEPFARSRNKLARRDSTFMSAFPGAILLKPEETTIGIDIDGTLLRHKVLLPNGINWGLKKVLQKMNEEFYLGHSSTDACYEVYASMVADGLVEELKNTIATLEQFAFSALSDGKIDKLHFDALISDLFETRLSLSGKGRFSEEDIPAVLFVATLSLFWDQADSQYSNVSRLILQQILSSSKFSIAKPAGKTPLESVFNYVSRSSGGPSRYELLEEIASSTERSGAFFLTARTFGGPDGTESCTIQTIREVSTVLKNTLIKILGGNSTWKATTRLRGGDGGGKIIYAREEIIEFPTLNLYFSIAGFGFSHSYASESVKFESAGTYSDAGSGGVFYLTIRRIEGKTIFQDVFSFPLIYTVLGGAKLALLRHLSSHLYGNYSRYLIHLDDAARHRSPLPHTRPLILLPARGYSPHVFHPAIHDSITPSLYTVDATGSKLWE